VTLYPKAMKHIPLFAQHLSASSLILLISSLPLQVDAQTRQPTRQYDLPTNQIDDYRARQSLLNREKVTSSIRREIADSDLGIQRPVEEKKTGFGYHLGFETKLGYSNNPASMESTSDIFDSAGVWENSLRNNFLLGAFDLGGASFSPLASINFARVNHFGHDDLDILDSDSLSISFAGIFQFSGGWSLRGSLASSFQFDPNSGMDQTYRETSPTIALGKGLQIGNVQAFIEWSVAYCYTNSKAQPIEDIMDRFETALLFGLNMPLGKIEFSPFLRFALSRYSNEDTSYNKEQTDFLVNLGLQLKYSFSEWLSLKGHLNLTTRNSNISGKDFTRIDPGVGAALDAKF
jgi:hypothetical protein